MNIIKVVKELATRGSSSNLFGSIASNPLGPGGDYGFIPLNGEGKTLNLTDTEFSPIWLGLDNRNMQYWAYNYCSPLAAVIDRLAEADTNGKLKILSDDGTVNKNFARNPALNRVMKLLARPNPLQTWEEFNSQQVVLCKIFGYCPVFAVGGMIDKTLTKSMWNLNPYYAIPSFNYGFDMFGSDDISTNPIKEWRITILGTTYTIASSDILLIKDGFVDTAQYQLGLPISKVAGLDYFVSNICAAMEADNVLLKKKGPLGIFSYDAKPDPAGITPMRPSDKKQVQQDLQEYGMTWDKLQYVVSKIPVKWNAMSFNLRDLMTKETVRQGIDGICDRFGYPAELMSGKNATYENRSSAEKFLYQNNIIPFSLRRMAKYDKFFGIEGLYLDYNHLPVLQDDILKAGEASKAKAESLEIMWTNGIITYNEYRIGMTMDAISGYDILIDEYLKKHPKQIKPTETIIV